MFLAPIINSTTAKVNKKQNRVKEEASAIPNSLTEGHVFLFQLKKSLHDFKTRPCNLDILTMRTKFRELLYKALVFG